VPRSRVTPMVTAGSAVVPGGVDVHRVGWMIEEVVDLVPSAVRAVAPLPPHIRLAADRDVAGWDVDEHGLAGADAGHDDVPGDEPAGAAQVLDSDRVSIRATVLERDRDIAASDIHRGPADVPHEAGVGVGGDRAFLGVHVVVP